VGAGVGMTAAEIDRLMHEAAPHKYGAPARAAEGLPLCPSRKQGYASAADADAELHRLRRERDNAARRQHRDPKRERAIRNRPLWTRSYECPACGAWHLTSAPLITHTSREADALRDRLAALAAKPGCSAKERRKLENALEALEAAS